MGEFIGEWWICGNEELDCKDGGAGDDGNCDGLEEGEEAD